MSGLNVDQQHEVKELVEAAKHRYIHNNKASQALYEEAVQSLPGGNTRTIIHADPFPICMKSGHGYQVTSEDGKV